MDSRTCYYARVLNKEQNFNHQIAAYKALGGQQRRRSSNNKNRKDLEKARYHALKSTMLCSGDTIVIKSLEPVSRNNNNIKNGLQIDEDPHNRMKALSFPAAMTELPEDQQRYQVFVSSTYEDLQVERQEVMQALLELDCIPSGMELFPASNEDQWSLIKRVIDDSDYYIVIIGGRYGSTNEDGISFTEMEYRYAMDTGKPIIAFLHKNPAEIKSKDTEQSPEGKIKLEAFRKLAEKRLVRYWTNPSELGSMVSRSMVKLIKQFPATGWVKADRLANEGSTQELFKLRQENEDLKNQLKSNKVHAPLGTEKLAQGEDELDIIINYEGITPKGVTYNITDYVTVTWNDLFAIVSPYLTIECQESTIQSVIVKYLEDMIQEDLNAQIKNKEYARFCNFDLPDEEFQSIKIQFKALGLITKSIKNRSVKDTSNYWTLTEYGDYMMTKLIAIKKS